MMGLTNGQRLAEAFEGLAKSGGRSFYLKLGGGPLSDCKPLRSGELANIIAKLPRNLETLTFDGEEINLLEVGDRLPSSLRTLNMRVARSYKEKCSVSKIILPDTLKTLSARDALSSDCPLVWEWISNFPKGLESIDLSFNNLEMGHVEELSERLGPNLVYLNVAHTNIGDEGTKILANKLLGHSSGLSNLLDSPVPHQNILFFYDDIFPSHEKMEDLCNKNLRCARELVQKSFSNMLEAKDVREAAQRLPSMVYLAQAPYNSDGKGLGWEEEKIVAMLSNLAKAAKHHDISLTIPKEYQSHVASVFARHTAAPVQQSWGRKGPENVKAPANVFVQAIDALGMKKSLAIVTSAVLGAFIFLSSGEDVTSAKDNVTSLKLPQVTTKPFDIKMNPNGDIDVNLRPTEEQKVNFNVHPPIER